MITPTDILNAGNRILKENFPTIPRESMDVEEGFSRECFFAELDGINSSYCSETVTEERLILRIHYFPANKYVNRASLMAMQQSIRMAFGNRIKVTDDFYIPVGDITSTISENDVLEMDIELSYMQQLQEDTSLSTIQNLYYE